MGALFGRRLTSSGLGAALRFRLPQDRFPQSAGRPGDPLFGQRKRRTRSRDPEVLDLEPGEAPEAGLRRLFAARTEPEVAKRCILAPYREGNGPAGIARYGFVPDAKYAKELAAKNDPNEVPDPPCGDWGDVVDSIQYWETHPKSGAQKVLFVRTGQDDPLFDEQTLEILPPKK